MKFGPSRAVVLVVLYDVYRAPRRRGSRISVNGVFEYQWKALFHATHDREATATGPIWSGGPARLESGPGLSSSDAGGIGLDEPLHPSPSWATGEQTDATGRTPNRRRSMSQIAQSGARFAGHRPATMLPVRWPERTTAISSSQLRRPHLRAEVLGGVGAPLPDLSCHRQPRLRPKRRGPSAFRELAGGCGGRHLRRSGPRLLRRMPA